MSHVSLNDRIHGLRDRREEKAFGSRGLTIDQMIDDLVSDGRATSVH